MLEIFSQAGQLPFSSLATKMAKSNSENNVHIDNSNQKVSWPKDTFAHGFRPIYIISRAFGLMPFSITFQSNGDVQKSNVSKFDVLWFAIWLCLFLFGIWFVLTAADIQQSDSKTFSMITLLGDTGKAF